MIICSIVKEGIPKEFRVCEQAINALTSNWNPVMPQLIDSHCHLVSLRTRGDLGEALERADRAGVGTIVSIGTSARDWNLNREIAAENRGRVAYTVGLHPTDIEPGWEEELSQLRPFFEVNSPPVALGEVGLDHFHLPRPEGRKAEVKSIQEEVFRRQLALAGEIDCPIVVHSRGAFEDCVRVIDKSGVNWERVVFHCFADGPKEMAMLKERGGRGSFTGIVTYKNATNIREAAIAQGLEPIMVETDAPYLSPEPKRGKPNEPALLSYTAAFCAELLGVEFSEFAAITAQNTRSFFGI